MLIQLIFFALMMLGIAALAVDMGMARLTQSQMQNAADTGALEGLRQRDATTCDPLDSVCLTLKETNRRIKACQIAARTFDDNFNNVDANCNKNDADTNPLNLGAGPRVAFTDGGMGGDLAASQTFDPTASGAYRPLPAINLANAQDGDLVAGDTCDPSMDPTCPAGFGEDSNYNVGKFKPGGTSAFLVRLRRSTEAEVPGEKSVGPTVPLLFARGTFTGTKNPAGYNPRVDGLTIRATAIADMRPVLSVGVAHTPTPGVTGFSLSNSCWAIVTVNTDPITACALGAVGTPAQTVGLVVTSTGTVSDTPPEGGFLPIFDRNNNRIIGFAFVQVTGGKISRMTTPPPPGNATAAPVPGTSTSGLILLTDGMVAPVLVR